jgi:methionyl-tRNA formyltransferase
MERLRVVFFGSPEFAVPSLAVVAERHEVVAVVTQPDRPAGRGKHLTAPPAKELALRLGLPVQQPTSIKPPAFAEALAALRPDLFIVVAYGRILPPALLEVPRLGPWNVHGSLLPRYRGAAPIQWSIIRGETRTGICIMRMEAGLDTGPVAASAETPISDEDTAATLGARLAEMGAALLVETIPRLASGAAVIVPQDHTQATLAPMLKKEDGWLDFTAPARAVSARARGVDPWPGPMAMVDGEVVKLFAPRVREAEATGEGEGGPKPGTVIAAGAEGLVVACGTGAVAFTELQLPGRKRLPAAAVLAGRAIPVGTILTRPDIVPA